MEKDIQGTVEKFLQTGIALMEIRDDELYREDGFKTWGAYLQQRVRQDFGIERSTAFNLITTAVIRPKLPDFATISKDLDIPDGGKAEWSPSVIREFARLAPKKENQVGRPSSDVSALRKQDVQRVVKAAVKKAKELGKPLTAPIVREVVNADIGVEPKKREPAQREDSGIELATYVSQKKGQLEEMIEVLAEVSRDGWTHLEESNPNLAARLAATCEKLARQVRG